LAGAKRNLDLANAAEQLATSPLVEMAGLAALSDNPDTNLEANGALIFIDVPFEWVWQTTNCKNLAAKS
jgi:hypothetical protein